MSHSSSPSSSGAPDMKLFWACFIALVATSFVFGIRASTLGELQSSFNLSEEQKGNINGAGMWPFALSIIFFSLTIDRIGYKFAALFALVCHIVSLVFTLRASGYNDFYWSTLLISLANGTVEAFINPVVATLFRRDKAKWLNILHAGWPAGLALGALIPALFPTAKMFFPEVWQFRFALCFVPVVAYALLILPCKFPVNERVAAGVTYREMLGEFGALGFAAFFALFVIAVYQAYSMPVNPMVTIGVAGAIGLAAGLYTRSFGNWLFLLVLIIIGPLATTELGTDGWMPELIKLNGPHANPEANMSFATWVFVYVSAVMTLLRFYAGPIVHRFSPIGLLVLSCVIAIIGLMLLSGSVGWAIVASATIYAFGKTFLWSTTLGLTSEQFPKGGALTLNGVSAIGVLFLGVLGTPFIGYQQDQDMHHRLQKEHAPLLTRVQGAEKPSIFGNTPSLDQTKVKSLSEADTKELTLAQAESKRGAFAKIAVLPAFMLICYLGMFLYFRSKGGYKPVEIGTH